MQTKSKLWRGLVSAALALVLLLGVTAMPLEGLLVDVFAAEPTPYIVIEDCDGKDAYTSCVEDLVDKMQGAGSVSTAIDGTKTIENTVSFKVPVDADMLSGWYLECWLYVDKVNNLQARESTIGIYQTSNNKAEIALNKITLKNGWNKIQVKLSNLTYTNKNAFDTINRVYLSIKTTRNTVFKLDDVCLIAGKTAADLSGLEAAIAAGDALAAEDFSGFDAANVAEFEAALAFAKTRLTDHSQRDVDVAETNLKNAMNAFGMEGYTADSEALVAYIDFNTKTYSRIDRFAIRNADGSEGGLTTEPLMGKNAAAVGGKLLLAVSDEYISATDATVRVTYTYYDGESGSLTLGYNSADNATATTETVAFGNTATWKRETAKVTDAAFDEAIDNNFDLQIALDGAALAYITRVEIKLVTESDVTEKDPPVFPEMTDVNNFEDKSVAGYQMWFTASPGTSGWVHWAGGNIPSNDRISFEMWPDTSEYPSSVLENTAFNNLGDGRPAQLFTSVKQETVDLHVSWMQDAGLDGFAIQRFYGKYNSGPDTDRDYKNLVLARDAAEKYGRVFYVMYDMNGGLGDGNYAAEVLKSDFVRNVEQRGIISSSSYAQMDGKPVVCMWGIDPGSDSYTNHDATLEFICWLQDRGYYVVGGTSKNDWYNDNEFDDVYRQLDMISPWTVGRYSYNGVADWMRNSYTPTIAECEEYGIEFQPVVIAGGSWHNHNWGMPNDQPHYAGNFLWRQVYLLKNLYKAERVYFAMFDEYDEGTAIMKAAQDSYDIPEDEQYFLTLATDGTWLSSDFNLRLAGYICDVMRTEGDVGLTQPVVHSEGPIYWRNSFEQRWTYVREQDDTAPNGRKTVGVSLQSLDVGLPMKSAWKGDSVSLVGKTYECKTYVEYVEGNTDYKKYGANTVGTGLHNDPTKTRTTNGTWSLQFNATAEATADDRFMIAQTDIMISAAGLELSYDVLADNALGEKVYMDLALEVYGETMMLSDYVKSTTTSGAKKGSWVSKKVQVPASLVGQKVVGILVGYTGEAGEINAYLDNVVLQSTGTEREMLRTALKTAGTLAQTEELAAAIAAGQAVYDSGAATPKQRLKAVKAIDNVIRVMDTAVVGGMLGDVDGDESITSTDARLTLQFYAGKIGEDDLDTSVADVDGDDQITSTDARLILQKYAGKIEAFPAE